LRVLCFLLFYARSQLTINISSVMQFSITAEDMHAARPAYDLDEVNGFEGEEPSDNQEFDSHDDDVEPMEDQWLDSYYESQTECDFGE
jgi:hypothetical protein